MPSGTAVTEDQPGEQLRQRGADRPHHQVGLDPPAVEQHPVAVRAGGGLDQLDAPADRRIEQRQHRLAGPQHAGGRLVQREAGAPAVQAGESLGHLGGGQSLHRNAQPAQHRQAGLGPSPGLGRIGLGRVGEEQHPALRRTVPDRTRRPAASQPVRDRQAEAVYHSSGPCEQRRIRSRAADGPAVPAAPGRPAAPTSPGRPARGRWPGRTPRRRPRSPRSSAGRPGRSRNALQRWDVPLRATVTR